jgi:alanine racemase
VIRATVAHIDLGALAHNYRAVTDDLAAKAGTAAPRVIAVVKANAYGHGAVPVARALEAAGAGMLACADIEEAVALREGGVTCRILVFGALSLTDLEGVFQHGLTPSVSSPTAAKAVQAAAALRGKRVRYHLKIDTGMNRLGFRHDNLDRTLPDVLAAPNLELEAVYTHFATADVPGDDLFGLQRARFAAALDRLRRMGARPAWVHAANSAATLAAPDVWFGGVRPGLLLYGVTPAGLGASLSLEPVMGLHSRIVAVKGVRPGETVGYGGRHRAASSRTIAVVPAGYADGLDRRLEGHGEVLVRGRRAPMVGSVCMDMVTIDVTGLTAAPGDDVVFIGRQGADEITVADMAAWIGTIPYEVWCRIGSRIKRVYNRPDPLGTGADERRTP